MFRLYHRLPVVPVPSCPFHQPISFPEGVTMVGQPPEQQHVLPAAGAAARAGKKPIIMGISVLAAMLVLLVGTLAEFFIAQVHASVSCGISSVLGVARPHIVFSIYTYRQIGCGTIVVQTPGVRAFAVVGRVKFILLQGEGGIFFECANLPLAFVPVTFLPPPVQQAIEAEQKSRLKLLPDRK